MIFIYTKGQEEKALNKSIEGIGQLFTLKNIQWRLLNSVHVHKVKQ